MIVKNLSYQIATPQTNHIIVDSILTILIIYLEYKNLKVNIKHNFSQGIQSIHTISKSITVSTTATLASKRFDIFERQIIKKFLFSVVLQDFVLTEN